MSEIDEVTIYGSNKWSNLKPLKLDDDDLVQVKWLKYYKDNFEKRQIVLHHTVSGPGIKGDLATWEGFNSHIACCVIIGRDGKINQLFSSRYWGYHIGCGKASLDKTSIAVELDNWGQLEERDGELYAIYGNKVDVPIVHYPEGFRGEQIFEAYPIAQLRALGELLLLWNKTYQIPLYYRDEMWDVSKLAIAGEPGIWSHVSYRPWPSKRNKWDVHPDPNLKAMLRTIATIG